MAPRPATVRAGPVEWQKTEAVRANTPARWIWERLIVIAPPLTTTGPQHHNLNQGINMPKEKSKTCPSSDIESSLSATGTRIIDYIQAGYAGLYLVSPEEQRIEAELKTVIEHVNRSQKPTEQYELCYWSVVDGLVNTKTNQVHSCNDPLEVLQTITEQKERTVFLLKDYHLFLEDPNPIVLRKLKDVLFDAKTKQKPIIITGCRLVLPPELERELTIVEFSLPGKEALRTVLHGVMESAGIKSLEPEQQDKVIDAASGLTTMEAENSFALSFVQTKTIEPSVIFSEKAQAVKKNGLLEIIEAKETLESIGGLDVLKSWLLKRKDAFGQRAKEYGLPTPKGLLVIGIPGTGKSLTAKATASVFGVPLLKLDAGRLFAGIVGQSESNLRSVIQTAEAIAPCCLWIDELEKGFAGTKSSGSTDGGTSARVFGSFISWMQEKTSPVFVVATANDVSQLPPEMLRKGRFDEIMFVDLPNQDERESIWEIQIQNYGRDAAGYDLAALAKATEGLTGSEVEQVFIEALFCGFDKEKEPTDFSIAQVLTEFVPLSKLMAEQISGLRTWAKGRAKQATTPSPSERQPRKIAA
jgi:ATP-dependent 26S proteasome regulatory subunit